MHTIITKQLSRLKSRDVFCRKNITKKTTLQIRLFAPQTPFYKVRQHYFNVNDWIGLHKLFPDLFL